MTLVPPALEVSSKMRFSSLAIVSRSFSHSRCSSEMAVTRDTSGRTISMCWIIAPGASMPTSMTAASVSGLISIKVIGRPTKPFWLPLVQIRFLYFPASIAANRSLVVVLPTLPATAITVGSVTSRQCRASRRKLSREFSTRNISMPFCGVSDGYFSHNTAAAPFSTACLM